MKTSRDGFDFNFKLCQNRISIKSEQVRRPGGATVHHNNQIKLSLVGEFRSSTGIIQTCVSLNPGFVFLLCYFVLTCLILSLISFRAWSETRR